MAGVLNKKAHGIDTILMVATIFGLAVFTLIVTTTYSQFVDVAQNTTVFNQSQQAIDAMEDIETVNDMWDYVILVIFIGFAIAMIVLGYFIDVHTIFFPIFVIVMLVGVLISAVLSYAWDQIANTSFFIVASVASFPIINHLMDNLVIYYVIIAALALTITYAKTKGE